jgi:hypothetical protein
MRTALHALVALSFVACGRVAADPPDDSIADATDGSVWSACTGPCTTEGASCHPNECNTCSCHAGVWNCTGYACKDAEPGCPPFVPGGVACDAPGKTCRYDNGCGGEDVATCTAGMWDVATGACAAFECPRAEPTAGGSCSGPTDCVWNNGCGALDHGFCDPTSGWQITHEACVSGCPAGPPKTGTTCSLPFDTHCEYEIGDHCGTSCFCSDANTWACFKHTCDAWP